jgi:hypothetical protein
MSAKVDKAGNVQQLDARPGPDENVTESTVKEPKELARFLIRLFRDVALLKRRWRPRWIDYEDLALDATGTTKVRLTHNFGGRVRFWIVDWDGVSSPAPARHSDTDDNALVLVSYVAGTATVRVEESG